MALVVDAQATASDSVAAHNNPIISSLDPISVCAQLRTAAPTDIAAAAASWLPSSTDLLAGSSDPGPPATLPPWNLPRAPAAMEHTDAGPDRWEPEFWIDGKLEGADGEKEVRCGG